MSLTDYTTEPYPTGPVKVCMAFVKIKAPTGQEQTLNCQEGVGDEHGPWHRNRNKFGGIVEWPQR